MRRMRRRYDKLIGLIRNIQPDLPTAAIKVASLGATLRVQMGGRLQTGRRQKDSSLMQSLQDKIESEIRRHSLKFLP